MEVKHLSALTADFLEVLKASKYRPACIKKCVHSWEHLDRYMINLGITIYSRAVGEAHIKARFGDIPYNDYKKSSKDRIRYIEILSDYLEKGSFSVKRLMMPPITFISDLGIPFNEFIEYAIAEKRPASTVQRYKERIKNLYLFLQQTQRVVSDIDAPSIMQFLSHLNKTVNGEVNKNNTIMTIRVFLRYLCERKLLVNNYPKYWNSILQLRQIRQPKIPSVYSCEEIERLIKIIDRSSPQGKRDYAMILLAARYGLRVSDIIGLRYCNLDWTTNRIILVQRKTGKKIDLPLSEEMGNAIIDYLKFGCPVIDAPYLFIKANALKNKYNCQKTKYINISVKANRC
ncbi:tyrosine-type recombinase/integrase [Arachidicoccus sp.]|uniref:tyrosine-type recombinase/integrase n=1 Tax=Arachidicoccus sp. TaxID=1872624 RepID=UPI003D20E50B